MICRTQPTSELSRKHARGYFINSEVIDEFIARKNHIFGINGLAYLAAVMGVERTLVNGLVAQVFRYLVSHILRVASTPCIRVFVDRSDFGDISHLSSLRDLSHLGVFGDYNGGG